MNKIYGHLRPLDIATSRNDQHFQFFVVVFLAKDWNLETSCDCSIWPNLIVAIICMIWAYKIVATFTFTFTYSLTTGVVGAPQMTSQPGPPFFSVLHCPLGHGELQACPFPDVVFPPLFLSALSSSPFHCALQDGFGQTWWMGDMYVPLQFASLYDCQEVFVWSDCPLYLGREFLVGSRIFVWDV